MFSNEQAWQIEAGYSADSGTTLDKGILTHETFSRVVGEGDGDGVYCEISYEDSTLYGFNVNTGDQIWKDVLSPVNPYDSIGGYMNTLANGTLYLAGFGGDIWSINVLTGKINWYTNTTTLQGPSGTDSPYGVWHFGPFLWEASLMDYYSSKKDMNTVRHYSWEHSSWQLTPLQEILNGR